MIKEPGTKGVLISIARNLFYTKGYDKTSIQNIIDGANVAKGTFYHYFKSKNDILNQITEEQAETLYQIIYKIVASDNNAIDKLNLIFQSTSSWKSQNISMMKVLISTVMSDANLTLRHTMTKYTIEKMAPVYKLIIDQGMKEGCFNVLDSEYSSRFILNSFVNNSEDMTRFLLVDEYTKETLIGLKKLLRNFENSIELLLGANKGSVKIIEDEVLEKFLKGLLED